MLYYASVQESALLYMQDSYRSVLPKNGSGRWSAFLWHFFKTMYIFVCQLLYMVKPCTVTSVHETGKMVKGSTGEHAVANTVVVYAYNMWYPCTVYVHVYTQYVHKYAMYIHVLTSRLNSSS
jgi:hypothetical protein